MIFYPYAVASQVEQTACAVLDMFPDLELAVEEGPSTSFLFQHLFASCNSTIICLLSL